MPVDRDAASRKARRLEEAIARGRTLFRGSNSVTEFDAACDHVVQLLRNSLLLYDAGSLSSSVFVAITALEEKAKVEVTTCRSTDAAAAANRREDALFNHREKHAIALEEVLLIADRLEDAIGTDVVRGLFEDAERGRFTELREASLYLEEGDGGITAASAVVDKPRARAILLLAIEAANDYFTGMTSHSFELGSEMNSMFEHVAAS